MRNISEVLGLAPTIARLIAVDIDPVSGEVNDISCTRAINVGEKNSLLVELIKIVKTGSIVHGDFGTKTTISEIGPVTYITITDTCQIRQSIAGQIGKVEGLSGISKD